MRAALVTTRPPPPPYPPPGKSIYPPRLRPRIGRGPSHPHRHQHIQGTLGLLVGEQRRRTGVSELEYRRVAFELGRDIQQITRVESDIERIGVIADLKFLGCAAGVRIGD